MIMSEHPTFQRPDGRPLPSGHHLSKNPRGKWVLKLTIDAGEKFSGRRITIQLRTSDSTVAMMKRDSVLEAYKLAGILCRDVVIVEM